MQLHIWSLKCVARTGDVGPVKCHFISGRRLIKLERLLSDHSFLCRGHQEGVYRCLPVHMQDWYSIKVGPNNWLSIFSKTCIGCPWSAEKTGVCRLRTENSAVSICEFENKEKAYGILCMCVLFIAVATTVQNATWHGCIAVLHSTLHFTRFPWDRGCWSGCHVFGHDKRDLQEINRNYSTDVINVMEVNMCLMWW